MVGFSVDVELVFEDGDCVEVEVSWYIPNLEERKVVKRRIEAKRRLVVFFGVKLLFWSARYKSIYFEIL